MDIGKYLDGDKRTLLLSVSDLFAVCKMEKLTECVWKELEKNMDLIPNPAMRYVKLRILFTVYTSHTLQDNTSWKDKVKVYQAQPT